MSTVYGGHIKNGQVVFDQPVVLPEGIEVRVEVPAFTSEVSIETEKAKESTWGNATADSAAATPCEWLSFVSRQLDAIAALPENWDSNGSPIPNRKWIETARQFLETLCRMESLPQPHVNPTPNGGIQFEWEAGDRYFEWEVTDDATAAYLYCDNAACEEESGVFHMEDPLSPIVQFIRRIEIQ